MRYYTLDSENNKVFPNDLIKCIKCNSKFDWNKDRIGETFRVSHIQSLRLVIVNDKRYNIHTRALLSNEIIKINIFKNKLKFVRELL